MKNTLVIFGLVFILVSAFSLTGCGDKAKTEAERAEAVKVEKERKDAAKKAAFSTVRLEYVRKAGVSSKYAKLSPVLGGVWKVDPKERELYNKKCASCHGAKGDGDSVKGRALDPKASDLMMLLSLPEVSSGYIFWAMTEGGGVVDSAMPSFKYLSEKDRWRIVSALRRGLK